MRTPPSTASARTATPSGPGDVLTDAALAAEISQQRYPLVLANIVADVIIPLSAQVPNLLTDDGIFPVLRHHRHPRPRGGSRSGSERSEGHPQAGKERLGLHWMAVFGIKSTYQTMLGTGEVSVSQNAIVYPSGVCPRAAHPGRQRYSRQPALSPAPAGKGILLPPKTFLFWSETCWKRDRTVWGCCAILCSFARPTRSILCVETATVWCSISLRPTPWTRAFSPATFPSTRRAASFRWPGRQAMRATHRPAPAA